MFIEAGKIALQSTIYQIFKTLKLHSNQLLIYYKTLPRDLLIFLNLAKMKKTKTKNTCVAF